VIAWAMTSKAKHGRKTGRLSQLAGLDPDWPIPGEYPQALAALETPPAGAAPLTMAQVRATIATLQRIAANVRQQGQADSPEGREIIAMYQALQRKLDEVERQQLQRRRSEAVPPVLVVKPTTAAAVPLRPIIETLGPQRGKPEAIRNLQHVLIALGYSLEANGYYNNATTEAVRDFQARRGVPVDGVVGAVTRKLLNTFIQSGES